VVAALTARAAALTLATRPADDEVTAARVEGWIAVPTAPLDALPAPDIQGPVVRG
jgi:hypothetical protein